MTEGTTLQIINNMIIINLYEIEEDVFNDHERQKVVFLINHLGGFNINYTSRTITLFLTLKGMYSYTVDFDRGGIDTEISQHNFNTAISQLGG
jgi:hypothetical protein